jgi:anthranilate synthase component II
LKEILLIDNYDSFTFNLVHLLEGCADVNVRVIKNDNPDIFTLVKDFNQIVISPGPGLPKETGNLIEVLKLIIPTKKVLGVCLGHQAIAEFAGAQLYNLPKVYHGVAHKIVVNENSTIFKNLPLQFSVARYHSWTVDTKSNLSNLEILACDEQAEIMAFKYKDLPVFGIQFHPESILCEFGKEIIINWLEI